jgi:DNA-binding transcriptional ArsR family regulator
LGVLADAGLVTMRRSGTQRLYQAQPEGLSDLLAFIGDFWDLHLARLAAAAEAEEKEKQR